MASQLVNLLTEAMSRKRWREADLVRETGLTQSRINRLLRGATRDPEPDLFVEVARALNLPVEAVVDAHAEDMRAATLARVLGAPEVALAPAGGFRRLAARDDARGDAPAADRGGVGADGGDDRVTRADFARLVARIEAVLSELAGRPVNLSCWPVAGVLRPVWRGLLGPRGARAWNPDGRGAGAVRVERPFPSGCRQPSRLASLPAGLIREIVGPSSPSRPGASLTRRSGSRA